MLSVPCRSFKALALICEDTAFLSHFGSSYCLFSIYMVDSESTLGDHKSTGHSATMYFSLSRGGKESQTKATG